MTGGYYNKDMLPETLSSQNETTLAGAGLFARTRGKANMSNSYTQANS